MPKVIKVYDPYTALARTIVQAINSRWNELVIAMEPSHVSFRRHRPDIVLVAARTYGEVFAKGYAKHCDVIYYGGDQCTGVTNEGMFTIKYHANDPNRLVEDILTVLEGILNEGAIELETH